MTLDEMREQAIEAAIRNTEADCAPVITSEIPTLVERHQRAQIWAAATPYEYDDVVQLPTRNGHRYRCVKAGISAATQDGFPTAQRAGRIAHRVTDGTVVWLEDGRDYANVFDDRAIASEGWMLKAGKASGLVTTSFGDSRIDASALQAQCRARAMDYAPLGVA